MTLKVVVDMNLSPDWVEFLTRELMRFTGRLSDNQTHLTVN